MRRAAFALTLIAAVSSVATARADDVSDALAEATASYAGGDLAATKRALDLASQLVGQRQAAALEKLLPAAPAGWTAEKSDNAALAAGFFGGGLTAERRYVKDGKAVTVTLMANSPILGAMAPLFSNVQLLGSMGTVFRQKGRTAVSTDEGEIQIVLGQTFLTVAGSAQAADKRAILDLVDLGAVEAFSKK